MFGVLMNNRTPRVDTFMAALYSTETDDPRDENILHVLICKCARSSSRMLLRSRLIGASAGRSLRRAKREPLA
jgi:hypothetical protein